MEASTWRWPAELSGSSVGNRPADIASVMACDTSVSRTTSLMPRLPLAPVLARPSLRSSLRARLRDSCLDSRSLRSSYRDGDLPALVTEQSLRHRAEYDRDYRP